jgi:uncharacterized phage protein (TIGR01671 family)
MREIKFRVWDKRTSQMSLVATVSFGDDGSALTIMAELAPKGQYYNAIVHGENGVLMQYAGLHDKNGVEVYEGDIVRATLVENPGPAVCEVTEVVSIHEGHLAPFYMRVNFEEDWWKDSLADGFEVIGNIYEHPELVR